MRRELFGGREPKEYGCPYCGMWHNWDENFNRYRGELKCPNMSHIGIVSSYKIWIDDEYFCCSILLPCDKNNEIKGKCLIDTGIYKDLKARYDVKLMSKMENFGCYACSRSVECNIYKSLVSKNEAIRLYFRFDDIQHHLTVSKEDIEASWREIWQQIKEKRKERV